MPKLIVRDRNTGRVKVDQSTPSMLLLGRIVIGGAGYAQSGQIVDERFAWGTPFTFITPRDFPSFRYYEAVVSISGNTLTWQYPYSGSQDFERPVTTILYGVNP